jgi:hypothetical protein
VVDGANAFIADAGSLDNNSALTGLSSISGVLEVDDGGSVVVGNNLANSGTINVDANFGVGGSELTVNGTLANTGTVVIGFTLDNPTAPTTVTVAHLVNSGSIKLYGRTGGGTNQVTLRIMEAAPAVLTGDVEAHGNALVEYSIGAIGSIASKSSLVVDGGDAFFADAGSDGSNSALAGLTNVSGLLVIENGSSVVVDNSLTNIGTIDVDTVFGNGGGAMTVDGTLINDGTVQIGLSSLGASSTVTAQHLVNIGALRLRRNRWQY